MTKTIAFANQKGGVGKTTSAINIAAALGIAGKRTLLIDCDPQGNASSGVGVRKNQIKTTVYDVLIGRCRAADAVIRTEYQNLSVIPSGMDLAAAELELADVENRQNRLKEPLSEIAGDFDYILIDCPPSLGMHDYQRAHGVGRCRHSDAMRIFFTGRLITNYDDDQTGEKAI